MNESELRDGLRRAVATADRPPMSADAMLDTARAAHRRRRTTLSSMGAAVAVVAIAVGGTVALSAGQDAVTPGGGGRGAPASGQGPLPTEVAQPTEVAPQGGDTETVWPTGTNGQPQQDRTAADGARYETGVRLLDELIAVVPPGHTVPEQTPPMIDPTAAPEDLNPSNDIWARYHQSQFGERVAGEEVWEHLASLAVSQGPNTGRLFVAVYTPGNGVPADLCTATLWGAGGICEQVPVGAAQVAFTNVAAADASDFEQWAAYRHTDGAVVFVAQSTAYRGAEGTRLPQPLFTDQELAELAVDERFHVE